MQGVGIRASLLAALVVSFCASGASAQDEADPEPETAGHHCLDEQRSKWVLHHLLAGQINPAGGESSARLGVCFPFITRPGVLFAYTSIEVGVLKYLSPAYGHLGGYVQITPLSLLQLRAELSGLTYWPFPFRRAGYFDLAGYDADFREEALPKEQASAASGWNLNLIGILRMRIPFGERVGLVLLSMWSAEYWVVGDEPFYFNLRRDLPLARTDWVFTTETFGAVEVAVSDDLRLRFGAYDSWRHVPAADYSANQVGLFLGAHWPRPAFLLDSMRDLQPFLRLGMYTAHDFRTAEPSALLGVMSSYDLGPL